MKETPYYSLCSKCTPYLYNKGGLPHQKARQKKKWKENRKVHIETVGNKCQWCDSEKQPFSIHHPNGISARTYDYIWKTIVFKCVTNLLKNDPTLSELLALRTKLEKKRILKQKLKYLEEKAEETKMKVCPSCLSNRITERKIITPRYRCSKCEKVFATPKNRKAQRYIKAIGNVKIELNSQDYSNIDASSDKVLSPLYAFIYDKALKAYDKAVKQLVSDYENMTEVIVLCKKCHSSANMGLIICACKKGYHQRNNDKCYECRTGHKWEDKTYEYEEDWEDWESEDGEKPTPIEKEELR